MAKRDYYCIVDTETTLSQRDENGLTIPNSELVADFGIVVCDRLGEIVYQGGFLVHNVFAKHPLFYIGSEDDPKSIWSKQGTDRRFTNYQEMLENGSRVLASVNAINKLISGIVGRYNPTLTAYNLPFDLGKCRNTGIELNLFSKSFCLWAAAAKKWAHTATYKNFVLQVHAFNAPTDKGNMTFKTNAETMTRFCLGEPELENEPHTALEDAVYYELPILKRLVRTTKKKDFMNCSPPSWQHNQVKNHFKSN